MHGEKTEITHTIEIPLLGRAQDSPTTDVSTPKNTSQISEEQYRILFESNPQSMWVYDLETLKFLAVNDTAVRTYGYAREEFLSMTIKDIRPKEDLNALYSNLKLNVQGLEKAGAWRHIKKNGAVIEVEITSHDLDFMGREAKLVLVNDITERLRAERQRQAIFEIIEGVNTTIHLNDLFRLIHESIGRVLYAENCVVALYEEPTNMLHFDFFVDKYNSAPPSIPLGEGLTSIVLRQGRSLLLSDEEQHEMVERGEVKLIGSYSASWIGVPLRTPSRVIGVLILQHYELRNAFSPQDLEFLNSVGGQIALAIERKQAEEAIRESESQYRSLFDQIIDPIFVIDKATQKILDCNDAVIKNYGYTLEELQSLSLIDLHLPEEREFLAIDSAITHSATVLSTTHITKTGNRKAVELSSSESEYHGRQAWITIARDVTESKQAEEALRQNEAKFKDLFENAPFAYHELDSEGRITRINNTEKKLLGYTSREMVGRYIWEFIVEKVSREAVRAKLTGNASLHSVERTFIRKDGTTVPLLVEDKLIRDLDGKITGIRSTLIDISERKKAEETIRQSEEKYRTILETIEDGYFETDLEGKLTFFNDALAKGLGYHREELTAMPFTKYIPAERLESHANIFKKVYATGQANPRAGWEIICKDGSLHYHEGSVSPIRDADNKIIGFRGLSRDLSDKKKAEEALRQSEEKYRTILETMIESYFEVDLSGDITFFNDALAKTLGYEKDELVGLNFRHYVGTHLKVVRVFRKVFKSGQPVTGVEWEMLRKDGTRQQHEGSISLIRNAGGVAIGFRVLTHDITERKRAEDALRVSAEKLQRSNRELQDFASVASHDLQEPLRKIQAFGDRLKTKCADSLRDQGRDYLDRMQSAANRMSTLINDLLTFSRVTTKAQPFIPTDLNEIVKGVVSDLEIRIEQTEGRVEIGELPIIDADGLQMRQLMQNLIGNALKFRRAEEPPVVKVAARTALAEDFEFFQQTFEADYCLMTIEDNGCGFDEKYLDRIFTVFQRLHSKSEYEGTGIGLAVCRKIVERHGGLITAKSQPGAGSKFIFLLPAKHHQEGH